MPRREAGDNRPAKTSIIMPMREMAHGENAAKMARQQRRHGATSSRIIFVPRHRCLKLAWHASWKLRENGKHRAARDLKRNDRLIDESTSRISKQIGVNVDLCLNNRLGGLLSLKCRKRRHQGLLQPKRGEAAQRQPLDHRP